MTHYIEHVHVTETQTPNGKRWRDSDPWWAVRTPEWVCEQIDDNGDVVPDDKPAVSVPGNSFILFGGQSVHLYDKDDIAALRGLLDKIEAVLA